MSAWECQSGRDLDPLPVEPGRWTRIVACLNIWNDLTELKTNYQTWYPYVDHVIAIDGAYAGMACDIPTSDDGTLTFLNSLDKVRIVLAERLPQPEKRSLYFQLAQPGDLLWRIDADERFENAQAIRQTPHLDVGWIRYTAPIYQREQGIPAVFAWRDGLHYRDRHHWVYDGEGRLISTQQRGGEGLLHRLLPIKMHNDRGARRGTERVHLARAQRTQQSRNEAAASPLRIQGHEPLRIMQLSLIDPGITVARLHSAINTTTPHSSVMATATKEWTQPPHQFAVRKDNAILLQGARTCDYVHCHLNYKMLAHINAQKLSFCGRIVIHHHGTYFRKQPKRHDRDDKELAAFRLVSNYELLQYSPDLHYLPNPVPFARYRMLGDQYRPAWKRGTLRVAHSPTKRQHKATDVFLRVCDKLNAQGLEITPVLIEQQPWADALVLKAGCHATFDSFWLGMQNSGLEAAAMGQPVIAGDEDCRREYMARFNAVPYTFANDETVLASQIEALATDREYFDLEARHISAFVEHEHDYGPVAARYLDLLDDAFKWREKLTIGKVKVPA